MTSHSIAVFSDSIYKYLPSTVDGIDFELHCRRGACVDGIRRGKIYICVMNSCGSSWDSRMLCSMFDDANC